MQREPHPGRIGAKRQSWSETSPRAILERIVEENPHDTDDEILELLYATVCDQKGIVKTMIEYWGINNLRALRKPKYEEPNPEKKRETHTRLEKAIKTTTSKYVANIKLGTKLMSLLLPHGKTLAETTCGECLVLGPTMGKWLYQIGAFGTETDIVGDILSEETVVEIYNKSL